MKSLKRLFMLVLCVGLLTACSNKGADTNTTSVENKEAEPTQQVEEKEVKEAQAPETEEVSLEAWEDLHPVWQSITTFYNKDYLQAAAQKHAEEDKTTAEALLKDHEAGAHSEIAAMEFSGNKITLKAEDGSELASSEYKYVKTIGKGEEHNEFAIFEATGDVPEQFKAFALMEPHGGEGDITHYHARYGKSVDDPALTDSDWWPVFVDPESTEEQVINEILGHEE